MAAGTLVFIISLTLSFVSFLGHAMLYPVDGLHDPPWGMIALGASLVVAATWAFAAREGDAAEPQAESRS